MDKTSSGSKKHGPASVSRKAYSIFGGIVNLAQSSSSDGGRSNVVPAGLPVTGGNVCASAASQDPQGSSNVYTLTVTNSQNPGSSTSPKTYGSVTHGMRKKKGVQSSSSLSSVNNSTGMSNNSSGPMGPAPRTISILTALNELAEFDEGHTNPGTALTSPPNTRRSSTSDNLISKSNPIHSSFQHPARRHSATTKARGIPEATNLSFPSPSTSIVYQSSSSSNNNKRATYSKSNNSSTMDANSLAYNEQQRNAIPYFSPPSRNTNVNTLPSKLRTGNKSLGAHKETFARKGAAKQRDRSKSRTPDWIFKIFQLTKLGKLEELQESLQGMDPTLIRHLTDARGNTLFHSVVRSGHIRVLKWLVSVLGSQCTEAALNDHNQAGRTVLLTALKKGQLQCLQWLVNHTKCGEKALVPNDGERSLLHFASSFGDVQSVRFLCSQLIDKGLSVDVRDASGMTPLHTSAKTGNIAVCHELILAGADPLSQTELGWRPSDLSIRHRHMECANYFMVAEAAGSLGNQLHSLLLAFNHLRQEHEELRSHFRETLRVGKGLSKERNDVIKNFNSNWSQEGSAGTTSTMLLGAATNGTRFSDMEHKLVLAEQFWKKSSQNVEDSSKDSMLNGEDHAQLSNISSQDFLQHRLAALQLRLERIQSSSTSLSGSSDEDRRIEHSSSSDDASSSDLDVEPVTAGSSKEVLNSLQPPPPPPKPSYSLSVLNHSSTALPNSVYSPEKDRMLQIRSKAAPWLLPPNDVFLSQLSPFVGSSCSNANFGASIHGKNLPTLDLLHGAPTSPSLIPPSKCPTTTSTTAATTEAAVKNEKSLVQMDAERHGGKRDSTSLEISVLEVIEPTSHASSSTSKKKGEDGVEQFQVSASSSSRSTTPWLDLTVHTNQKTRGMSRSLPNCGLMTTNSEIRGEEGNFNVVSVVKGDSGRKLVSTLSASSAAPVTTQGMPPNAARGCTNSSLDRLENEGQMLPKSGNQAPDLICGMQYRIHSRRKSQPLSLIEGHNRKEDYHCEPSSREKLIFRRSEDPYETIVVSEDDTLRKSSSSTDEVNRLDISFKSKMDLGMREKDEGSQSQKKSEKVVLPSHSSRRSQSSCDIIDRGYSSCEASGIRSFALKSRTPSPKSYVTKLTVIPVDPSETCFLSMKSNTFVQRDHQEEQDAHLPGDNQDDIGLSHIPCDSVSSSNTPVMPRFHSSGSVVFPLRKPDWHSSELLSFPTPDSSLAGRLSPTPSETSRTESALAPPASYISHASQNSELSKTESQRGPGNDYLENSNSTDVTTPASEYVNNNNRSNAFLPVTQPIIPSENSGENDDDNGNTNSSAASHPNPNEIKHNPHFSSSSTLSSRYTEQFPKRSSNKKKFENDHTTDSNDGSTRKPNSSHLFSKQRFQPAPFVFRSFSSTGEIHKPIKPIQRHHHHQRLPKGARCHTKPWYEIEGSDDEGSLLRVATKRSSHSHSSSPSSSPKDNNPESSAESDSEGNVEENESEKGEHDAHVRKEEESIVQDENKCETKGQRKISAQHHHHLPENSDEDNDDQPSFL